MTEASSEMARLKVEVLVLMGAQISAPLLLATPTVNEMGTRHKPLSLRQDPSSPFSIKQIQNFLVLGASMNIARVIMYYASVSYFVGH